MMSRERVGKLQAIIGAIVLIGAIAGTIYFDNSIKNEAELMLTTIVGGEMSNLLDGVSFSSNESRAIAYLGYMDVNLSLAGDFTNRLFLLYCSAVILIMLSVVLFLQGLANLSESKK